MCVREKRTGLKYPCTVGDISYWFETQHRYNLHWLIENVCLAGRNRWTVKSNEVERRSTEEKAAEEYTYWDRQTGTKT